MFTLSAYPAPVLRWRQGPVMSRFLTFMDLYRDEAACIAALAGLRWPNGFTCAGCAGRLAYQLAARPRVFECADCGRQAFGDRRDGFDRDRHQALIRIGEAAAPALGLAAATIIALIDLDQAVERIFRSLAQPVDHLCAISQAVS